MLRALLASAASGALAVGLLTAAPVPVSAVPNDTPVVRTRGSGLGELPVTLPSTTKRSLGGTAVAVGETLWLKWDEQPFDADAQLYASRLDVLGAIEGQAYQLTLNGSGPISAFVVDAGGEIVMYAGHPSAQSAAPTLEWEYAPGDFVVLVSDDLPLDRPTAMLTLIAYTGDGSLPATPSWTLPANGVSGTLRATSPAIPFHGGHFDVRWTLGSPARGNNVVLSFAGAEEDTDWLSVVVLDKQQMPVDEIPVESGIAAFTLADDETFVVTSFAPDDFGSYSFEWLTGSRSEITDVVGPSWWTLSSLPGYRVEFDRPGPVAASSGWTSERALSHRVEVSRDGRTWTPGKVERPASDIDEGGVRVLLLEGQWHLRLVCELGGVEFVAEPIAFRAAGDDLGWTVTSMALSGDLRRLDIPGQQVGAYDLRKRVLVTERYRDGSPRSRLLERPEQVQFRYAGTSQWMSLADKTDWHPMGVYWAPATGYLRLASTNGKVVSKAYPVTVPEPKQSFRATVAKPKRSTTVGGAMIFKGSISRLYSDGRWRVADDGSGYQIQQHSGKKWKRIHSGQVKATGKGEFAATVPLPGKGPYRLLIGGKVLTTWKSLNPAKATRTAKIAKPVVTRAGTNRYAVRVGIRQLFSDGRWGPGRFGWTYQLQYREVGAKKWRSTPRSSIPRSSAFDDYIRVSGDVQFRVKARYKGRVYYSPVTKA